MIEKLYTPKEAAAILHIGYNTILGKLSAGEFSGTGHEASAYRDPGPRSTGRKPGPWRIPESAIRQYQRDARMDTERAARESFRPAV